MSARPGQAQASHRPPIPRNALTWQDDALCREMPHELFFPEGSGTPITEARRVCLACEVREQCLSWALDNREEFGVWGGKSEKQRKRMLRELKAVS